VVLEPVVVEHIKTAVGQETVVAVEIVVVASITLFECTLNKVMSIEKWDSGL
jgi:hypothetical protein